MSKTKIRCNTCGRWFQSANAKDLTCPDCVQKARREKTAAKNAPPSTSQKVAKPQADVPPPPKPKSVQSGTNQWLDTLSDVKLGQPEQPARPKSSPAPRDQHPGVERHSSHLSAETGGNRDERGPTPRREGESYGSASHREHDRGGSYRRVDSAATGQRPRQPTEGVRGPRSNYHQDKPRPKDERSSGVKPKVRVPKPPSPAKAQREKTPPPQPFMPTPEQTQQVEERYLQLVNPTEYDGIRSQISKELNIPKTAVKKIIKELRERHGIPSWWELQTYKGNEEELAKVKELYVTLLPLPPVGVHKNIAQQLSLKTGTVYQAIKVIRHEMNLPQYNDPVLHGLPSSPDATHDQQEQAAQVQPCLTEAQEQQVVK
ncbi:MAG: hypothetical protein JOZ71_06480 [Ktedonobacteraceae bacterium]|nr:hypothetical protein [Ktedonobacteraceae bacterium]